jgi:hypothetical protein
MSLLPQGTLPALSVVSLAAVPSFMIWFGATIEGKPEGLQKMWHDEYEQRCVEKVPPNAS